MMAGRGPAPKEDPIRRNAPTVPSQEVEWDGDKRGPELPELEMMDSYGEISFFVWHPRTVEWWNKWRCSPQAMVMHESDWESMLETAMIHTRFWSGNLKPTEFTNLASELRRRVAAYGATYEDRLRLRMVIKTDQDSANEEKAIKAEAAKAINYADRLLKAASEEK